MEIIHSDRAKAAELEATAAGVANRFINHVAITAAAVHATTLLLTHFELRPRGPLFTNPRHIAAMIDMSLQIPKVHAALREANEAFRCVYEGGFDEARVNEFEEDGSLTSRRLSEAELERMREAVRKLDTAINYLPAFSPAGKQKFNG